MSRPPRGRATARSSGWASRCEASSGASGNGRPRGKSSRDGPDIIPETSQEDAMNMKKSVGAIGAVVLAGCALSSTGFAAELAGAKMPDTLTAGEKTLKLNGLGLRKKAIFK